MKLYNSYIGIIIILISQLILIIECSKISNKNQINSNHKKSLRASAKEGPLKKISRSLRMDMSSGAPKSFREARKDHDDDDLIASGKQAKGLSKETQSRIGKYDPKYGVPVKTPSGWIPNLYPKCIVTNELATKYKFDDGKNQKKLKKCALKHVFKSIDLNKDLQKKCMNEFKRNHTPLKGYGYMLSALMKYAKNGIDSSLDRHFSICGIEFIDELRTKAKQYNSNLKIAISLFANLDDLFTYPPTARPGYVYVKRKLKR